MNTEELLKPRYKTIASFPNMNRIGDIGFPIDKIFYPNITHGKHFYNGVGVQGFPHLFRKLSWWEDREEKDMPEYVKHKTYPESIIHKVKRWYSNENHYGFLYSEHNSFAFTSDYLPATKEEYESFKNQNK